MSQFTQQQGQTPVIDPIPTVVARALDQARLGHYSGQVRPVVDQLIQREQSLMETVVAKCVEAGMSQQQALDICQAIGAHFDATRSQYGQWAGTQYAQGQTQPGQSQQTQGQQSQGQQGQGQQDLNRRVQELERLAQQVQQFLPGGGF